MKARNNRWMALAAFVVIATTFVAWKNAGPRSVQQVNVPQDRSDTTPARKKQSAKKEFRTGDFDDAMKELDRAMADLDKNLKIDMSKVNDEVKAALDQVKKIDFDQLNLEVSASLDKIDWDGIHANIEQAMREAKNSIKSINKDQIRASIDAAKNSVSIALDNDMIQKSVNLGLKAARVGIEKAKHEIRLYKGFMNDLEKDGLIQKNKHYKIRVKDHELYIDGKKQSKEVNQKYSKYFKDGDYTLSGDLDDDDSDDDGDLI